MRKRSTIIFYQERQHWHMLLDNFYHSQLFAFLVRKIKIKKERPNKVPPSQGTRYEEFNSPMMFFPSPASVPRGIVVRKFGNWSLEADRNLYQRAMISGKYHQTSGQSSAIHNFFLLKFNATSISGLWRSTVVAFALAYPHASCPGFGSRLRSTK